MEESSLTKVIVDIKTRGLSIFNRFKDVPELKTGHRLQSMLLVVCVSGEISATVDLRRLTMTGSSILVLRPGHAITGVTGRDFEGFIIVGGMGKLASVLPTFARMIPLAILSSDNPVISVTPGELEAQQMLFELLRRRVGADLPYNEEAIDSLVESIFYDTLGLYTLHFNRRTFTPTRREELMLKFSELLEQYFRTERSVRFYATRLCVTPKHLSAVVKEASGMTAGDWIDSKVILEAKMMLRNSDRTVQEISIDLNFPNQSFFGKYFKHHTGYSPREWRGKMV